MVKLNGILIPHLYFDTNFILDVMEGDTKACQIIENAKEKKWKYSSSIFTLMEALDIKQEHYFFKQKVNLGKPLRHIISLRYERDLHKIDLDRVKTEFINKFRKDHSGQGLYYILEEGWQNAYYIVKESNITSSDAIHLATAISAGCDILLTSDKFFIKEGNKYLKKIGLDREIKICKPKDLNKTLKDMNFKV